MAFIDVLTASLIQPTPQRQDTSRFKVARHSLFSRDKVSKEHLINVLADKRMCALGNIQFVKTAASERGL